MRSHANCIDRGRVYYYVGCNGFQQLILSGVRIEYNDQLTHQGNHGSIDVYKSGTTTLQNSGICSNGNRRYYSFPVEIYFANITGSFQIFLGVTLYTQHNSFSVEYAGISGNILVQSRTYMGNYKRININIKNILYIIHKQA